MIVVASSVCTERGLHTATNYFIVSLAIADIMVAILVMPLAVYVEVRFQIYTSHSCTVRNCTFSRQDLCISVYFVTLTTDHCDRLMS